MTMDKVDETVIPDAVPDPDEMPDGAKNSIAAAIADAEEIPDCLDGLIERVAADPGAPFTPEVLTRLSAVKKEDLAGFEVLRTELKKVGCRITALDEAIMEESGHGGRSPTQTDILINLAGAAELFSFRRWHCFRRSGHQRAPGNLAGPHQGVQALVDATVFRSDGGRAEFGGSAIRAQRD